MIRIASHLCVSGATRTVERSPTNRTSALSFSRKGTILCAYSSYLSRPPSLKRRRFSMTTGPPGSSARKCFRSCPVGSTAKVGSSLYGLFAMQLEGIHHITAITGDAPRNVDFYTRVLGLRMAAKTVNQDDPTVYHLFYADELARPGSELTFFEYPGARAGEAGAGMVHTIVWRVGSAEALDFWAERLGVSRDPSGRVLFEDPEGLGHEIVVSTSGDEPLAAEHPEIPAEFALQGFEAVRAYTSRPEQSAALLERILGAKPLGDDAWDLRGERRGSRIAYDAPPAERGRPGGGTVHHVAWGTTVEEHPRWQDHL